MFWKVFDFQIYMEERQAAQDNLMLVNALYLLPFYDIGVEFYP